MLSRRQFAASLAAVATPFSVSAQEIDLLKAQYALVIGRPADFSTAIDQILARGDTDMVAGMILSLRFSRAPQGEIINALSRLTGVEDNGDWFDWMKWQERNPQIKPHPSFIDFKRAMMLRIDPNFDDFMKKKHIRPEKMHIRLEEITWGGVRKDGIPSLDNPTLIDATDAAYMRDDDLVFGVSINGDARAYPLRIMGWHEMFNDVVGGVPLALAYCTLCGSGILFETKVKNRAKPLIFGSSGFLYRSNKLMFDRGTDTLWNQFTGKPVSGRLADSGIELAQRPVVIDTWANWKALNPATKVLSLDTGHDRDYGSGVVYQDYFASSALMFPTNVDQSKHRQKDYVFGVRQFGGAKAWPLNSFENQMVINDGMVGNPMVLLGDVNTRSVRAYERGELTFTGDLKGLTASDGSKWTVTEDAIVSDDGRSMARVAGHIAYWFAWNGYLSAESELYEG
jgi:hypothetical protein